MTRQKHLLGLLIGLALPQFAIADHVDLPEVTVTTQSGEASPYQLPQTPISVTDSGELLKKLPGANINRNGPLTSIVQYRGMYGDRVSTKINGIALSGAGPNSMDTPLSYIPSTLLDSITLYRGISPVSSGIETIGGSVSATSQKAEFGTSDEVEMHSRINGLYNTNGDGTSLGLLASMANQNHRFQFTGSTEQGDDQEFSGGDIVPSEYDRNTYGLGYGYQQDSTELDLDFNHLNTGDTGTAALPMDIRVIRGDNINLGGSQTLANGDKLSAKLHYQDIYHMMDNYTLRQNNDPTRYRYTDADVIAQGVQLAYEHAAWQFGVDFDTAEHNADIFNPNNGMFFVNNFNNVERDRISAFAEWTKEISTGWKLNSGVRVTNVKTDADEVDSSMAMMGNMMGMNVRSLRDDFNNADRSQSDTLADIAFTLTHTLNESVDVEVGVARKQRAPSYQERYLWLPLQSTGGLADGRTYIGNIELDPETSYQLELALDWHTQKAAVTPRVFYHYVDDYIQGVASTNMTANMVSNMMSGNTALEFANVDAELYGMDANWIYAVSQQWELDGTVSYVRGKRRDTDDNLYRIAPLTARTQLSYVMPEWRVGMEAVTVASQSDVSEQNDEEKTAGYAFFNLNAQMQVKEQVTINAGINNIFDRYYEDHLGGINRAAGNDDIAVGSRLPGLGRSLYVGFNAEF